MRRSMQLDASTKSIVRLAVPRYPRGSRWTAWPIDIWRCTDRSLAEPLLAGSHHPLRDRDDLKFLTGEADDVADGLAHQQLGYRGNEGNRTGLGVRFVLSDDMIFLHAPVVAPEGHRAAKGNGVVRCGIGDDLSRPNPCGKAARIAQGSGGLPPPFVDVFDLLRRLMGLARLVELSLQRL